jgi:uncharacterized membrane protein
MIDLITLFGIPTLGILFVEAEPMIKLKRMIGFNDEDYFRWKESKKFIYRLINCVTCSTFWIGLIITGNIYLAAITSILGELIYKIKNRL